MSEIDAMKAVDDALNKLDEDARGRVLTWAYSKFGKNSNDSASTTHKPNAEQVLASAPKITAKKTSSSKKSKSVIAMDKSLNLSPAGKMSAIDFAANKSPTNAMQKSVVACYYLREVISVEAITVSGVYTFFKTAGWKVPSDLRNALQKAGSAGWLDTADGENIKITSMGENLIEHDLPASKD